MREGKVQGQRRGKVRSEKGMGKGKIREGKGERAG